MDTQPPPGPDAPDPDASDPHGLGFGASDFDAPGSDLPGSHALPSLPSGTTVLQVLPSLEGGGVERGTLEMAEAIVRAGGRALVASAGGRMVPLLEHAGARHVTMDLRTKDPLGIAANAVRLGRLVREQGVSLVHARSRAPAWSALWASRRQAVPFVTTWHGVYSEGFPGKRRYNAVMGRGERVIAISRYVAAEIARRGAADPARVRVVPRGVDTAGFDPRTVSGERVHRLVQAWRLPEGVPVVMLPARLTRWKGQELLIEALARMRRTDAWAVLVGAEQRAGFAQRLQQQAARLGVDGRLRLAGHCCDMPAALMLADVVVSASIEPEPFGRAVVEAQAMGRVVVAADHGGAAETVEPGVSGWLVPPRDPQALAELLDAVLCLDPPARAAFGAGAREAVCRRFSTTAMQRATLKVYRELLG